MNKADTMLYEYFNKTLWDKIGQQDDNFFDEVDELRAKVAQIKTVCFEEFNESSSKIVFEIPLLLRRNIPKELREVCNRLELKEKDYIQILKRKQEQSIKKLNLDVISKFYYKDTNNSRIYHEFRNRTDFNLTRNLS